MIIHQQFFMRIFFITTQRNYTPGVEIPTGVFSWGKTTIYNANRFECSEYFSLRHVLNERVKNTLDSVFSLSELCAAKRLKALLIASEKPVPGFLLALPLLRAAWSERRAEEYLLLQIFLYVRAIILHLRTVSVTACLKAAADGAVYDAMMRYPDGRHSVDGR